MVTDPFGDYSSSGKFPKYIAEAQKEIRFYENILNNDCKMENISAATLLKIISGIEKKDCELRSLFYELQDHSSSENDSVLSNNYDDFPVKIEMIGNTVVISMPPIIKKYLKTPRYLKMHMRAAFMKYRFEHPEKPLRQIVASPVSLAVVRLAPVFNTTLHVDNDNYELHDIINAVMEEFGISDNAENMDYSVIFRSAPGSEACTKIYISAREASEIRIGDFKISEI